jgi:hypothetical protein
MDGIELTGCSKQTEVALADQVAQAHAAVLVFLGDGDDEAQIALDQLLHRLGVAGLDQAGNRGLLRRCQQWGLADLEEILIEDVPIGIVNAEILGGPSPGPPGLGRLGLGENIGGREVRNRVGKRLVIHRDKITLHQHGWPLWPAIVPR